MHINKKIAAVLPLVILLFIALSGCTTQKETNSSTNNFVNNKSPKIVITTSGTIIPPPDYIDQTLIDAVAYSGETVTFDASDSYDPDGEIISFLWIWEDNTNSQDVKVERQFDIPNVFDLQGLPLVYSIILQVEDDNQSKEFLDYRIGIIPKKHLFYLDNNELKIEKPGSNKDTIKATLGKFRPVQELKYDFKEPIIIQKCTWNATVYVEKPLLAMINKISISLYDDEEKQITKADNNLGLITLWTKKSIQLTGTFDEKQEFESIKIVIYGFSLRDNIDILYGGENPSHIYFDFTT